MFETSQDALINQKRSSEVLSNLEKVLLRRFGGQKTKSAISVVHDLKPNQPFGLVRFRFIKGNFFLVVHSLLLNRTSSLLVHFKSNFLFVFDMPGTLLIRTKSLF